MNSFNSQDNEISIPLDKFSSANYQQEKVINVFVLRYEIRHARNSKAMER